MRKLTRTLLTLFLVVVFGGAATGGVAAEDVKLCSQNGGDQRSQCEYLLQFDDSGYIYCLDTDWDWEYVRLVNMSGQWCGDVGGHSKNGLAEVMKDQPSFVAGDNTCASGKVSLYWQQGNKSDNQRAGCIDESSINNASYDRCRSNCRDTTTIHEYAFLTTTKGGNYKFRNWQNGWQANSYSPEAPGNCYGNQICIYAGSSFSDKVLCESELGGIFVKIDDVLPMDSNAGKAFVFSHNDTHAQGEGGTTADGGQYFTAQRAADACVVDASVVSANQNCAGRCTYIKGSDYIGYDANGEKWVLSSGRAYKKIVQTNDAGKARCASNIEVQDLPYAVTLETTEDAYYCTSVGSYSPEEFCTKVLEGRTDRADGYDSTLTRFGTDQLLNFFKDLPNDDCFVPMECAMGNYGADGNGGVATRTCIESTKVGAYNLTEIAGLSDSCGNGKACVQISGCGTEDTADTECVAAATTGRTAVPGLPNPVWKCGAGEKCVLKTSKNEPCADYINSGDATSVDGAGFTYNNYACKDYAGAVGEFAAKASYRNDKGVNVNNHCDTGVCVTDGGLCVSEQRELANCCKDFFNEDTWLSGNDLTNFRALESLIFTGSATNWGTGIGMKEKTYGSKDAYKKYFEFCNMQPICPDKKIAYNTADCATNLRGDEPPAEPDDACGKLGYCCDTNKSLWGGDAEYNARFDGISTYNEYFDKCAEKITAQCSSCNGDLDAMANNGVACANQLKTCLEVEEEERARYEVENNIDVTTGMLVKLDPLNDYAHCGVDGSIGDCGYDSDNPTESNLMGDSVGEVISHGINNFVFPIALVLLLALLIWGGVEIVVASTSGQQNKIDMGKKRVTAAIIGFVILFAAYGLLQLVEILLGLKVSGV